MFVTVCLYSYKQGNTKTDIKTQYGSRVKSCVGYLAVIKKSKKKKQAGRKHWLEKTRAEDNSLCYIIYLNVTSCSRWFSLMSFSNYDP